jgi:uncharacterized UPF0160 family protein
MNAIKIITHNEKFHPDDVFAVATLLLFLEGSDFPAWRNRSVTIIRTRDESLMGDADFIVDVGSIYDEENNKFDHHQVGGAGQRENTIPFASFGLVWKKYGEHVAGSEEIADAIDEKLVQVIDAYDNGVSLFKPVIDDVDPYLITNVVFSFLPSWHESADMFDTYFREAVTFAQELLKREIKRAQAKKEASSLVEAYYKKAENKQIIVLDQFLPWQDVLIDYPEPLFVIYPRNRGVEGGKWNVSAVPIKKGQTFENRKDFPKAWAGKRDGELAKISGISDAIFCHNGLFLAVANSKAGALELAKKAINA